MTSAAAPYAVLRVLRDGTVLRDGRLLGYVDRYDHRTNRRTPGRTWRWVIPGGQVSRVRYRKQAEAVQALLVEAGVRT